MDMFYLIIALAGLYVILPIYMLSRIVTILYPYWIAGYLSYHGLWSEMQLFELVMLGSYIALQWTILILGIFVFRTHRWLWHVAPGSSYVRFPSDLKNAKREMVNFYDGVQCNIT